jgi:hypothetical protein
MGNNATRFINESVPHTDVYNYGVDSDGHMVMGADVHRGGFGLGMQIPDIHTDIRRVRTMNNSYSSHHQDGIVDHHGNNLTPEQIVALHHAPLGDAPPLRPGHGLPTTTQLTPAQTVVLNGGTLRHGTLDTSTLAWATDEVNREAGTNITDSVVGHGVAGTVESRLAAKNDLLQSFEQQNIEVGQRILKETMQAKAKDAAQTPAQTAISGECADPMHAYSAYCTKKIAFAKELQKHVNDPHWQGKNKEAYMKLQGELDFSDSPDVAEAVKPVGHDAAANVYLGTEGLTKDGTLLTQGEELARVKAIMEPDAPCGSFDVPIIGKQPIPHWMCLVGDYSRLVAVGAVFVIMPAPQDFRYKLLVKGGVSLAAYGAMGGFNRLSPIS